MENKCDFSTIEPHGLGGIYLLQLAQASGMPPPEALSSKGDGL